MTEVFIVDASPLFDPQKCAALLSSIPGELCVYLRHKRVLNDRARSMAGYLSLAYGAKKLGFDFDLADIVFDTTGKPKTKNGEFFFSLSHSGDYSVCAISDSPVGIDIEQVDRITPLISRRFLGGKGVEEWTRREARGKVTGKGFAENELEDAVFTEYHFGDYHMTVCGYEKAGKPVRIRFPS